MKLIAFQTAPLLDGFADAYRTASHAWLARLVPVARGTFTVLAGIEVALSGIIYGFRRHALDDVAARFVLKFGLLAVLLAVVTNVTAWLPPIIGGFAAAGRRPSGRPVRSIRRTSSTLASPSPGGCWRRSTLFGVLAHPATAVFAAISALIVIVAYVLVAAQLVLALVESYVVLTAGVVFLGFAACRATAGIADGFLTHVVRLGVRIFLLYLIVSLGSELSRGWIATISADQLLVPASPDRPGARRRDHFRAAGGPHSRRVVESHRQPAVLRPGAGAREPLMGGT